MITKSALLLKTPEFHGDFLDEMSVWKGFNERYDWESGEYVCPEFPKNIKILYADYTYENYSGDAYVLGYDKQLKKLFEVHGSHCSCHGLEDQWEPEYCEWNGFKVLIQKRMAARDEYWRRAENSKELAAFLETD